MGKTTEATVGTMGGSSGPDPMAIGTSGAFPRWRRRLALAAASAALLAAACGGGGGGGGTPAPGAPVVTAAVANQQVSLSWTAASGATSYQPQKRVGAGAWTDEGAALAASASAAAFAVAPHLVDWSTTQYRVQACNTVGCTPSAEVGIQDKMLDAIVYAKASNAGAGDRFGFSVAVSADGTVLAVGAPSEASAASGIGGNQADDSLADSGAVYVFARSGAGWSQQAYVKASNPGSGDLFGLVLALSADGSTLAVGSPYEDSGANTIDGNQADESAVDSGAVYVFVRSGATWSQQAYVKASNAGAGDWFGSSVALSADGGTLAIGAPGEASVATGVGGNEADNAAAGSGAVYVYARSGATWSQQAYAKATNTGPGDGFGFSVALSADGNTLAAGAPYEDSNATTVGGNQVNDAATNSGAVYVLVRAGAAWSHQAYAKASNAEAGDNFGFTVALSADGNLLAVGAPNEDSGTAGNPADNTVADAGAVYVLARAGATWSQQAFVKATNAGAADRFGLTLALSADGGLMVVGAPTEDGSASGFGGNASDNSVANAGAVYVLARTGASWAQQGYVKASNPGADDRFGQSVALSGDAARLFVGATGEAGGSSGLGGTQNDNSKASSGAVYFY